jgi:hypothetical protein
VGKETKCNAQVDDTLKKKNEWLLALVWKFKDLELQLLETGDIHRLDNIIS